MKLKLRMRVYDSWWPWKLGRVTKVLKTRVHITWSNGEVSSYDTAHQKFLRAA